MSKVKKILITILFLTAASFVAAKDDAANGCACDPKHTSKAFSAVAKKAIPAVVFIRAIGTPGENELMDEDLYQNPFEYFGDDFLNRFFGVPPKGKGGPKQQMPQVSQGSGVIVSEDGYILTNAHVVKGAEKITVVLNEGNELEAKLIGTDPTTDVAVIKVEGKNLPHLNLGNSDDMEIGEWVVAIGSPFQLNATLTVGVISAKGRQNLQITKLEDFIQTDAAINPGNSGGPLLNLDSEVIGINTAIVSRSGGYMGIGFAIPSNIAKNVMNQLIQNGTVVRGFLGVSLQPVDKDIAEAFNLEKAEGALVAEVVKGSPAEKEGLKQGDIILEFNNTPVKSPGQLQKEISFLEPGAKVSLKINRKGQTLSLKITLGKSSDAVMASAGMVQELGMEVENLTPELAKKLGYTEGEEAVVITRIKPNTPASQAGLRPGFLLLAVNHKKIKNVSDFNEAINESPNKKRLLLLVRQGNVTRFYSIKLD